MPKELYKIEQFHGGLNTNSDPRDLPINELAGAQDIVVDQLGKVKTMGAFEDHFEVQDRDNQFSPGYGLFQFSHDRIDGHTIAAGANEAETGAHYLAFSEADTAGTVDIYSQEDDTWGSPITGMTDNTSGLRKDVFYYGDGALRISDADFGNANEPVWYGYVDRYFFGDGCTGYDGDSYSQGLLVSQWFKDTAAPKALPIKAFYSNVSGTAADISSPITIEIDAEEVDTQDLSNTGAGDTVRDSVTTCVIRVTFSASSPNVTVTSTSSTNPGLSRFCSIGDKILITGAADAGNNTIFTVSDVPEYGTDPTPNTMDFEETVAAETNDTCYMYNLSKSEWFDPINTGWEVAVSTLYDDSKQESALSVSSTVLQPADVVYQNTIGYDKFKIVPHIFAGDGSSTGLALIESRVSGFKIYMRRQNTDTWYLQSEIDMTKGYKWYGRGDWEMWADAAELTACATAVGELLDRPREIETYESETGYSSSASAIGFDTSDTGFKTGVIANGIAYVGNVRIKDWKGNIKTHGDAILKSAVGKYDSFTLERRIATSKADGDSIVKLEEYADRLLEFKKNKMSLINISQEIEFLEDVFMHKGAANPAAVCKTDYGIAWINNLGCFLYDGQKVNNLLEKGGRQLLKQSDWNIFIGSNTMIGYIPKKRQLIVARDNRNIFDLTGSIDPAASTTVPGVGTLFLEELAPGDTITVSGEHRIISSVESNTSLTVTSAFSDNSNDTSVVAYPSGHIFLYDMVSQSWTKGHGKLKDFTGASTHSQTNFVVDWNNDLIHIDTSDTGNCMVWNDRSASSTKVQLFTKDIDFGQPGQKKNVYKVYISYKGDADSIVTKYSVNGDSDTLYQFNSTNTPLSDQTDLTKWHTATLIPSTASEAKNIYSFQLHMGSKTEASTDGTVDSDFEINDITIVFRLKGRR